MRYGILFLFLLTSLLTLKAQSTAFVFQGGLSLGTQKWDNSFDRKILYASHFAIAVESVNNDDDKSAFFVQLGYHIKGSAVRFLYYNINSGFPNAGFSRERFEFRNLSLILGFKQKFALNGSDNKRYYYFGGLRGDYTLSTNLEELPNAKLNPGFYPLPGGVRHLIGGFSVGGGFEFSFSELVGGELKVSLHPDVTLQYRQNPIPNVVNPNNPGTTYTIPERRIRNTTLEVGVGLRLLRKVVYVD
ncbi:MAG: hypothetical protein KGS48_04675 [Bacteroidetes bacterium]|nr:hypothetical protein [Bacteroidota bacterium]